MMYNQCGGESGDVFYLIHVAFETMTLCIVMYRKLTGLMLVAFRVQVKLHIYQGQRNQVQCS